MLFVVVNPSFTDVLSVSMDWLETEQECHEIVELGQVRVALKFVVWCLRVFRLYRSGSHCRFSPSLMKSI